MHTQRKNFDSCKDKDCIEDLRVYPTCGSQEVLDRALSVKAGTASCCTPTSMWTPYSTAGSIPWMCGIFIGSPLMRSSGPPAPSRYAVWPYLTSGPSCSAARGAPSLQLRLPQRVQLPGSDGQQSPHRTRGAIAYKRPCPGHRRQKPVDRSRSLLYTPRYTPDIPCIPFPSWPRRPERFITR